MKKFFIAFSLLIFACSSDDVVENSNNINDGQYFFEIEFGGETHRVQGVNSEMLSNGQNSCLANLQQGNQVIQFQLNDITADDFLTGQPIIVNLIITNPQLGNNTGYIQFFQTPFTDSYAQSLNINFSGNNFVENTSMNAIEAIQLDVVGDVSNINLTDLGTSPSDVLTLNGGNIKGSYEGVLYFIENGFTNNESVHDIPVSFKISFNTPRIN